MRRRPYQAACVGEKLESRLLRGSMTERGTVGVGEPQISRVEMAPLGAIFALARPGFATMEFRPLTSPTMIHGSMVTDGAK